MISGCFCSERVDLSSVCLLPYSSIVHSYYSNHVLFINVWPYLITVWELNPITFFGKDQNVSMAQNIKKSCTEVNAWSKLLFVYLVFDQMVPSLNQNFDHFRLFYFSKVLLWFGLVHKKYPKELDRIHY